MSHSEDFDGGSLPSGWTWDPDFSVGAPLGGITPLSPPDVLALLAPGTAGPMFGTFGTTDGAGGVVDLSVGVNAQTVSGTVSFGVTFRGNHADLSTSGSTYYRAVWTPAGGNATLKLFRVVSGTPTQIGSTVTAPAVAVPGWYILAPGADASNNIYCAVQEVSTGHWLASGGGSWGAPHATALTVADGSPITGAGTWGVTLDSAFDNSYVDNVNLATSGGTAGAPLPPWRVRRPEPRRTRGRAVIQATPREVGYVYLTPHTPGVRPAARRGEEILRRRRGRVLEWSRPPVPVPPAVVRPLDALRIVRRPGDDHRQARRMPGAVWPPPNGSTSTQPGDPPYVPPLAAAPIGWNVARRRPWRQRWTGAFPRGPGYNVYRGPVGPDRIAYEAPIRTTTGTTDTEPLAVGEQWFGVRAVNVWGEERNLDCAVRIVLDAEGNDITDRPAPPVGLRAFARAGAALRVEWWYPEMRPTDPTAPAEFRVYATAGASVVYGTPAAVVPYNAGIYGGFVADLGGLADGQSYAIGVRAANRCGAETNTAAVACVADASGPAAVDALTSTTV